MQVQSRKANDTLRNYANGFTYTAAGAVSAMRLGNGKWESTAFNSRLQPVSIGLGGSASDQSLLKLDYTYGVVENNQLNTAKNNGNIQSQTITVPTVTGSNGFTAVQTYNYDSLNRIDDATEMVTPAGSSTATQSWKQDYTFDRYGNRNFIEANTTTIPKYCANNSQVCPADRKVLNPSISASTNRINLDQDGDSVNDYAFDASGNTTKDANGRTFVYDAENKQIEVKNASNETIGKYWYDGDGRRVKKRGWINGQWEETIFVYDASSRLAAEYSTILNSTPQVAYLTNDHLGSPRINTNENGAVVSRHDYRPYGEEITERTHTQYAADTIRKQFTGYERDGETELDFAQARYFASGFGRFSSPDPILISAKRLANPQIWNGYSYVGNNPLKFVDPLGLEKIKLKETEAQLKKDKEDQKAKKEALIKEKDALKKNKATQEEAKAKQKEIDGLNRSMSALDRKMAATRAVQTMLDALDEVGERNGLQLSDFTVSTDPGADYASEGQTFVNKLKGSEAIAVTEASGAKMIIINAQASDGFYSQMTNFADPNSGLYVYKGAAILRHEQRHNQGGNENAGFTTERAVFNKFRPKFLNNMPLYDALDAVIANGIAKNSP